jgi:hypothetical protein
MELAEISSKNMKDTNSTGSPRFKTISGAADAVTQDGGYPAPFNMRKRIGSTAYEVAVYFSAEGGETMDDKILRLVRSGTVNGKDEGK